MTAIAFAFTAVIFVFWLIVHFGSRDQVHDLRQQRDDLREQLRTANETVESLTEIVRFAMRGERKNSRDLRVVKGGES